MAGAPGVSHNSFTAFATAGYDERQWKAGTMANSQHVAKLKKGVRVWNEWRKAHRGVTPNLAGLELTETDLSGVNLRGAILTSVCLSGSDLSRANLRGADISAADLSDADLSGAKLREAKLSSAYLRGSDFGEADLCEADLAGADLRGVSFCMADLSRANLSSADLRRARLGHANLTGAVVGFAAFGDNDLSDVKGLDAVVHTGPSTIGIDTIYRSHGNIPLAFLRGAGVPDNFIAYMGSLTGKALEFYSCFISYSTKDQEFADRLHADLQNKGVRCWFAPHDIQAGKKIHEQIDEAIRRYERLLLILSPNSKDSEWVKTEIRKARKRERTEKKRVLFPVRLVSFEAIRDWELSDADEGKDLAVEIREYYIPDFSDWKNHDSYTQAFQNLLRDLKAEGSKAA